MTAFVVDASVAAKWFLPPQKETQTDEALQLLKDYTVGAVNLVVPDLFWSEFANILWKAVRYGRMPVTSAEESIAALAQREIITAPAVKILREAFAIATTFNRTVDDAVYVALAVTYNIQFVTADERLANALAARFPVRWLGSY